MAILVINNAIGGLSEGSTVNATAQNGVLATDSDPFGYALAVSAIAFGGQTANLTSGSALLQGGCGTPTMHADGSYTAKNSISLPPDGVGQDQFTFLN